MRQILALVACSLIAVSCANEAPQTVNNTYKLPEYLFDNDNDGFPDLEIGGQSVTVVCEVLPDGVDTCASQVSAALKGTGDCDANQFNDPAVCWVGGVVGGTYKVTTADCVLATHPEYFVCAPCINPGAPEVPGDGVDNNCDGLVDNCTSDAQCNDSNSCTTDTCNPSTHLCVNAPKAAGIACSDNNVCSQLDQCDGAGACVGTAVDCEDGNPCTQDICNATLGCQHPPQAEGAACDDGDVCTENSQCISGACMGGTPLVCDDSVDCTDDVCIPGVGCQNTVNNNNCDDGDACTDDVCDASLGCTYPVISCDDGIACTVEACDPILGCLNLADDTICDNGLYCDGAEVCDDLLGCLPGPAISCDDGIACTIDTCNEAGETCEYAPNNAACDNTLFCDGVEVCTVGVGCEQGTPPMLDDGIACTIDTCNEVLDKVVHSPDDNLCDDGVGCSDDYCNGVIGCFAVPNHGMCDDGAFCNGTELCDLTLDCQPGMPPNCDDVIACTDDSCNEATDQCDNLPNDANCDDGVSCTVDTCEPGSGDPSLGCVFTPDDTLCDDTLWCNGVESCHLTLDCQAGNPIDVDDQVTCTIDVCDEANDEVTHTPDNTLCDDGAFCNGVETCDVSLGCQAGTPPSTDDQIDCTLDGCDDEADQVTHMPVHESCPVIGELCDPAQVAGVPASGCFAPLCDPINDQGGETTGDCAPYRDDAGVPADDTNPVVNHYGWGCNEGTCVAYEDTEYDEWPPFQETDCDDGVDGDLDGDTDAADIGACGACTPDCEGLVCGDDGCGGSCGACSLGETCQAGVCVGGTCTDDGDCALGETCVTGMCINPLSEWVNCWDSETGDPYVPSCDHHVLEGEYVCWSPAAWDYNSATPACECWDMIEGNGIEPPAAFPQVVMCCRNSLGVSGCADGELEFTK